MIGTLQANYNSRLAKMYILNASFGVMFIWKIISNFINPVTRSKIKVFSEASPKELIDDIHPSQIPRQYGGTFDLPKKAWPPTFPPQTYRDEYNTMHFTVDEFKTELIKNKAAVPFPKIAKEMKGTLKGKRVPEKTYYLQGKNELYDQFNAIIEPQVMLDSKKVIENKIPKTINDKNLIDVPNKRNDTKTIESKPATNVKVEAIINEINKNSESINIINEKTAKPTTINKLNEKLNEDKIVINPNENNTKDETKKAVAQSDDIIVENQLNPSEKKVEVCDINIEMAKPQIGYKMIID